ncbi:cobalt-precorrin-5B (C1)-methyltransferase [Sedimentibacter acidaminivorans]|uniref:Cobalt-precorrin-5B C(1)-methyltransferase n=1 Tax=Sedimentibacter acidaminivorans TaxID=913099 RepID=A0ABS4GBM5_9FIRM|nr:cobalt-precorrin-5B (C(1))-methyltransferase CbiD [Sedimentibacter acidaminivorans]MBP1925072.1 cobalt-precorrin-5B (C1)-methyltransferase [Sedimentibacter acidaminivorans]
MFLRCDKNLKILEAIMKDYIVKNGKKLRCGITTGTCATASATAAIQMLLSGNIIDSVFVRLPDGEVLSISIFEPFINGYQASCCVKKYSGDDPDVTDGILIYAYVRLDHTDVISIDGGEGVGRVTQKGLDCPVGHAAINSVPIKMIKQNVQKVCDEYGYRGGVSILISVPEGKELAKKTFNPHLGIIGGISIIGTTGIVEPMSEKALIDSLKVEMRVIKEKGYKEILAFPGNYAKSFIDKTLGIRGDNSLKFSNYLGEVLDYALELEFDEILIVGHIGKMVKVAGGMMNTHSHNGDFRMEVLACYAALFGADKEIVKEILSSITTEQAIEILIRENIEKEVIDKVSERAEFYINKRVDNKIKTKLIIYSNEKGILN